MIDKYKIGQLNSFFEKILICLMETTKKLNLNNVEN